MAPVITPIIILSSVHCFLDKEMLSPAPSFTGVHVPFAYLGPALSVLGRAGIGAFQLSKSHINIKL